MVYTGQRVAFGWNLFTAETSLMTLGLVQLLPALARLGAGSL